MSTKKFNVTVYETYRVTRIVEAEDVDEAKRDAEDGKGKEVCRVYDGHLETGTEAEEIS
jgi:hypothetical protein